MSSSCILLVEDNPLTRKMLRFTLEGEGYGVLEATSGREAMTLMESRHPELVLLDLILPDVDGVELARRLRACPAGREIPILVLSGYREGMEELRGQDLGISAFLLKPIAPSLLLETVRTHLPPLAPSGSNLGKGRRVLLVDDNPVELKLNRMQLQHAGFVVEPAEGGAEALTQARRVAPEAIVSDVLMPGMDGFELCLNCRRDPGLSHIPVLLLSSFYAEAEDLDLAHKVGASALLQRGDEAQDWIGALMEALVAGPPSLADPEFKLLSGEHTLRILRQLERQVRLNEGLAQQSAQLSAQLAVLRGVTELLASGLERKSPLRDVLCVCQEAAGFSRGALFLMGPRGLYLEHAIGFSAMQRERAAEGFGDRPLLQEAMAAELILALPSPEVAIERSAALLHGAGLSSALLAPLVTGGQPLGLILLGVSTGDPSRPDVLGFMHILGSQIGQALALASAFAHLSASEARYRTLMESSASGILLVDAEGRIREANRRMEAILGRERPEIEGASVFEVMPALDRAYLEVRMRKILEGETLTHSEWEITRPDGRKVEVEGLPSRVEVGGEPFVLVVLNDVTERNAMRRHTALNEKLATMGNLAAGIIHEINNPATYVLGSLEVALLLLDKARKEAPPRDLPFLDKLQVHADRAMEGARRIQAISASIKGFARMDAEDLVLLDVEPLLERSLLMAQHEIRRKAVVERHFEPVLPKLSGNPGRLEQLFLNLLVNAAQAMGEDPAGNRLTVTTAREGNRVRVDIEDTGSGIPPDLLSKIFDPYFTTKPTGVGTGLGLPICHEIARQHGGEIRVESEVGKGTRFIITLSNAVASTSSPELPARPRPQVRILLVEPDERLRARLLRSLEASFQVVEAQSGREALQILTREGQRMEAVVTEVVMPDVNGLDLLHYIVQHLPLLWPRLVFLGEEAMGDAISTPLAESGCPCLVKPFQLVDLLNALPSAGDPQAHPEA